MLIDQMASYICEQSDKQTVAAFLIDGKLRVMKLDGKRFERMMEEYSYRCLGVYRKVSKEFVLEDINYLKH